MEDIFAEFDNVVEDIKLDCIKFFDKGNKAAGTRARVGLQNLKRIVQDIRIRIQESKKVETK